MGLRSPAIKLFSISGSSALKAERRNGSLQRQHDHRLPSWSRDGEWIYFASDRGDGYQVWKRHVDRGEEKQITRKGGWAAIEGADGFVYYTKAADHTVWRVPQEGGEEVQILGPLLSFNPLTASDAGLYYMPQRDPDGRSPIMFYDFADGSTHQVYRSPKPLSNGISVGPGERFLLFSQIDREGSDLRLVENFR